MKPQGLYICTDSSGYSENCIVITQAHRCAIVRVKWFILSNQVACFTYSKKAQLQRFHFWTSCCVWKWRADGRCGNWTNGHWLSSCHSETWWKCATTHDESSKSVVLLLHCTEYCSRTHYCISCSKTISASFSIKQETISSVKYINYPVLLCHKITFLLRKCVLLKSSD